MNTLNTNPSSLVEVRKALWYSAADESRQRRKDKYESLPDVERQWKSKVDFDEVYPRIFISGWSKARLIAIIKAQLAFLQQFAYEQDRST